MKRSIVILLLYLLINRCDAFDLTRTVGGRAAAMGQTSACEQSPWALWNNPAGLSSLKGWHFGIYYENQWLLKETAFKTGVVAKALDGIGCIGLGVSQFGGISYSENQLGIAYARDFGPYLQMGLQAEYLLLHWDDSYPNQGALSVSLGIQSQVTKKLRLGVCLFNPMTAKLKTLNEDRIPTTMRLGFAYQFTDDFMGQCEAEFDNSREGVQLRSGLEYLIFKCFSLRAGVQYHPNILSFGLSYEIHEFHVDVAAQMHQLLGASLQIGMEYRIP